MTDNRFEESLHLSLSVSCKKGSSYIALRLGTGAAGPITAHWGLRFAPAKHARAVTCQVLRMLEIRLPLSATSPIDEPKPPALAEADPHAQLRQNVDTEVCQYF